MFRNHAFHCHITLGDRGTGRVGPRNQPVGHDGVLAPMEAFYAFDNERVGPFAADPSSHALQEGGQVDHFGLCGSVLDHRGAVRQARRHE